MKKLFLFLTALLLALPFGFAQNRLTITENFDKQNSCTFTRVPQDAWVFDTLVSTSGKSVWGFVPTGEGDSIELISPMYDFTHYQYIIMRFSHICKVSDSDQVQVMYRENYPGAKWLPISTSCYMGSGATYRRGGYFNQSSYAVWEKNNLLAEPEKHWWQTESFDVSPDVALAEVQFKFILRKGSQVGTNFAWGWLIDNFELVIATSEIRPPLVEIISPFTKGTVYGMGPHTIYAKAAPRTLVNLQTPQLFVSYISPKGIRTYDTIPMTRYNSDSVFKADIPMQIVGTQVLYTVYATDTVGNDASASSAYEIGRLWEVHPNCAAILSIDTPLVGALAGQKTPVAVTIQSRGTNVLTAATIEWSVNGVAQTPFKWTGSLEEGMKAKVAIGTYVPKANHMDTLIVKVTAPNADTANPTPDDRLMKRVYGCSSIPAGTFTVSQNGTYKSVNDVLDMIRSCGTSGNVDIVLEDGTYTEAIDFSDFMNYMAPGTKLSLTSKSADAEKVVLKSDTIIHPVITMPRAGNISISKLTLSGKGSGIVMGDTNYNVEITGCRILLDTLSTVTNYSGIVMQTSNATNIRIEDNFIEGAYCGLNANGLSAVNPIRNLNFNRNVVRSPYYGNRLNNVSADKINNNTITARVEKATAFYGLYLNGGGANQVMNNRIHATKCAVPASYALYVYNFNQDSSKSGLIANNEILINSTAVSYGIYAVASEANFYQNTVVMSGTGASRAMYCNNGTARMDMNFYNNIFVCYNAGYPAYITNTNNMGLYTHMDYNNYYAQGANIGYLQGNRTTLAAWIYYSKETGATNIDPAFFDYNLSGKCAVYNGLYCPQSALVPNDIQDSVRNKQTVMGCYSAEALNCDLALMGFIGWPTYLRNNQSTTMNVRMLNAGGDSVVSAEIHWSLNGVEQQVYNWTGKLQPFDEDTLKLGPYNPAPGNNSIVVWIGKVNGQNKDNSQEDDTLRNSVYACGKAMAGSYNVGGANADFVDLTEALFVLNTCGIGGNVTLKLAPGHYPAMKFEVTTVKGLSDSTWLTFTTQHDTDKVYIDGAAGTSYSTHYGIYLDNNAGYLHFDNLILNCASSYCGVSIVGKPATPVHDIKISRCLIQLNPTGTTAQYGIFCTNGNAGGRMNIEMYGNHIDGGTYGIYFMSGGAAASTGHRIDSNLFTNQYQYVMDVQNVTLSSLSYNTAICRSAFGATNYFGLMAQNVNCIYACNNYVDGSLNSGLSGQFRGIYITLKSQGATDTCFMYNNFVKGFSTSNLMSMYVANGRANVCHNTVYTRSTNATQNANKYALSVYPNAATSTMIVKNNNLCAFGCAYTLYISKNQNWVSIDNNNYYSVPLTASMNFAYIGSNLKDFKAVQAFDTNAVNALPEYLNIEKGGQYIARKQFECAPLVKKDYTGALRTNPTHIGAYNGLVIADNVALIGLSSPAANSGVTASTENVTVLVENKGDSAIRSLTLNWSINGVAQTPVQWKGNIAPKAQEKISLGKMTWAAGANNLKVVSSQPNGHADQQPIDDTLNVNLFGCTYAPLKGKYTIGSVGANFATLDEAVNALRSCGIGAPVVMELASGSYPAISQTGEFPGATAQNNVTFVSKTGKAADVIIGATDNIAISLNSLKYVTFRNVTIGNPVTSLKGVELAGANSNIRFEHCIIYADTNATASATPVHQNGGSCDSVFFVGNDIIGGVTNMQLAPGSGPGYGMVIDSNRLLGGYSNGLSYGSNGYLRLFTHNYIRCRKNTTANYTAINWGYGSKFDTVGSNRIYIDNAAASAYGMAIGTSVRNGKDVVINNEFFINSTSTSANYGVYTNYSSGAGAVGGWVNLIHNTFYISGKGAGYALYYRLTTAGSPDTYVPSKPAQNKYNNLYVNANTNSAVIYYDLPQFAASPYVVYDYNNYYNNNGTLLGNFGGVQAVSIADMVANTGQDGFSITEDPAFKDLPNSLHVDGNHLMVMVDSTLVRHDLTGLQRPAKEFTNIGCYHDYAPYPYDVKMHEIVSPTQFGAVGKQLDVEVKIVNLGTAVLDSVEFHWTVNGTKMPVYVHHGALAHGEMSKAINIGKFVPVGGMNDLVIWTEKPNGKADGNTDNDTLSVSIMGCDSALAGVYRVGKSAAAKYKTIDMAVKALSYCGISAPVVFEIESGLYDAQKIEGQIIGASEKNTVTFVSVAKDKDLVVIGGDDETGMKLKNTGHIIFRHITIGSTDPKCANAVRIDGMANDIEFNHCGLYASNTVTKGPAVMYENEKSTSSYMVGVRFIANEIRGGDVGIMLTSSAGMPENCAYDAKQPSWVQVDSNLFVENGNGGMFARMYNHITSFSHNTVISKEGSKNCTGVSFDEYNRVDSVIGNMIRIYTDYGYGMNFMGYVNDFNFGKTYVPVLVANNEILCKGGIYATGITSVLANLELVHNSLYMGSSGSNYGLMMDKQEKGYSVNVRNNIIDCENGKENYAMFLASMEILDMGILTSDYNVFYGGNDTSIFLCEKPMGFSAWKANKLDQNSKISQPNFINSDNSLEIRQFNSDFRCVRDKVITTDIKGNARTRLTVAGAYSTPLFEGYDLSVNCFVEPVQEEIPCVPNATPVKVCIYNQGTNDMDFTTNPMKLYLKCESDSVNVQTSLTVSKGSLGVMCSDTFELISNLDITYLGMYKLTSWLECSKDQQAINDTLVLDYQVNKTILPYDNDFSGSFTGVKMNQVYGDISWEVSDTNTALNPAFGDHRAIFRSSEARGSISQILFSSVRLQGSFRPQLYFWYAHDNANPNLRDQMDIRISQDGGATFKTIGTVYRYDAKCTQQTWKMHHIDLSNYTSGSCIVLSFMAYSYGGGDQALDLVRLVAMQDMALTVDVPSDSDFYACNLSGNMLTAYLENQTSQEVPFSAGDSITVMMSGASNAVYKKALYGRLEDFEIDTLQLGPVDYVGGKLDVMVYVNSIDSNRANDTVKFSLNLNPDLAIIASDPVGLTNPGDTLHAGITLKNVGNLDIVSPFDVRLVVNGEDTLIERITTAMKVGATLHYTFQKPYTVPATTADQPYFLLDMAALLSCDANPDNDSLQVIGNVDVIDYGILAVTKPSTNSGCNKGGEEVAIEVRLFNNGTVDGTDSLELTAVIDSAGVAFKTIVEKVAPMFAGENRNHVFVHKYTVPRLSVNNARETYKVTVFFKAVEGDIYPGNDTADAEGCVEGGVGLAEAAADRWNMGQNIPNPAAGMTKVPFMLPEAGNVIFNIMGLNGQVLYREEVSAEAGRNELEVNTSDYAAGIYYYSMEYKGQRLVKKMNVLR